MVSDFKVMSGGTKCGTGSKPAPSEAEGTAWWTSLTEAGGEGMVVKPLDFILRGGRGLAQPAVKCRGREYR